MNESSEDAAVKFRGERDDLGRGPGHRGPGRGHPGRRPARAVRRAHGGRGRRAARWPAATSTSRSRSRPRSSAASRRRVRRSRPAGDRHRPGARAAGRSRSRSRAARPGISAGRSQFTVRVLPAEEFLRLPEPAGDAVTLAAAELAAALHQVVRAASHDDARPILTGVLLAAEAGRPAAGGHRLLPAGRCATCPAPASWPRASRCWCRPGPWAS